MEEDDLLNIEFTSSPVDFEAEAAASSWKAKTQYFSLPQEVINQILHAVKTANNQQTQARQDDTTTTTPSPRGGMPATEARQDDTTTTTPSPRGGMPATEARQDDTTTTTPSPRGGMPATAAHGRVRGGGMPPRGPRRGGGRGRGRGRGRGNNGAYKLEKPKFNLDLDSDHDVTCDADFMETQSIIDIPDDDDADDCKLPDMAPGQNTEQHDKHIIELWQSKPRRISREEKFALVAYVNTLIEFSNITVFSRTKNPRDFRCFYCSETFEHLIKLREHQTGSHQKTEAIKILNSKGDEAVSAEITDLKCTLCEETMASVNVLKTHLVDVHGKKLNSELGERVIPFKAPEKNLYICQVCSDSFITFGAIYQHMDVHYNNYVCKDCGSAYAFRWRLDSHRLSHRKGVPDNDDDDDCKLPDMAPGQNTEQHDKHIIELWQSKLRRTREEKNAHIVYVNTLIEFSNITVFSRDKNKRFRCFYCSETFEHLIKLREHQTETHQKTEAIKILNSKGDDAVSAEITDLKCTLCEEKMASVNVLKTHLVDVHGKELKPVLGERVIPFKAPEKNLYICQVCSDTFETFGAIYKHMDVHYNNYVCKDCGSAYAFRWRLDRHRPSHKKGCFTCEQCAKSFTHMRKLTNHLKFVHRNVKRAACPQCPERFDSNFQRQKHLFRAHGMPKQTHPCKVCERPFNDRSDLSRHMKRIHLKKKDHHCEKCSFKGVTKYDLKVHMETHTRVKRFLCSLCDKTFRVKASLKEHLKRHANAKDEYVCDVCGKVFRHKRGLTNHINSLHSNK